MSTLIKQKTIETLMDLSQKGFQSARTQAREAFATQGLPEVKSEEYKFTAITKKLEQRITNISLAESFEISKETVDAHVFKDFDGDVLVFANGFFQPGVSSSTSEISVSLLSEKPNTLIGSIAKPEKDPFCAINQASFADGIFIGIPKNMQLGKPVLLLNFTKISSGQVVQPRIWIEAGDFAEATFIELTINLTPSYNFVNKVVEIKGGASTHLHYYRLQNEGANALAISNIETDVQKDSTFSSVVISLSGEMLRNNLSQNIVGSNSEANMYGLYLLNGKTHVDNHTNVDHTVPHAESNELYKGILADYSRGVFNGKIFVRQDAQKTNAFQQNNNILLSEDAMINTKPQLEIWADDVKCSHGCTTGQLDEEALFYIQSRGIGKLQAKGLLLYAFAGEVLEHIKNESFKSYCTQLVEDRLGAKF